MPWHSRLIAEFESCVFSEPMCTWKIIAILHFKILIYGKNGRQMVKNK